MVRLLGMEKEIGPPLDALTRHLWAAQPEDGGVAHSIEIWRGGGGRVARSGSMGESTTILAGSARSAK